MTQTLRQLLLAIIAMGLAGTAADLLLLGHYEEGWQLVPLPPEAATNQSTRRPN